MREILNVKELSMYLRCSESCIRKLKREKKIPYFRVSGKILFDKEKINMWLKEEEFLPSNNISND